VRVWHSVTTAPSGQKPTDADCRQTYRIFPVMLALTDTIKAPALPLFCILLMNLA